MSSVVRKQDLPPSGGYEKIPFKRIPAKQYFKGWTMIAGYLGITAASFYVYYLTYKGVKQDEVESRSARLALFPMLVAERDRAYLKQLSINRELEKDLMKNVEGWEVGTLYGEPIYKTLPKDALVDPTFHEYYVHIDFKDQALRSQQKLWT